MDAECRIERQQVPGLSDSNAPGSSGSKCRG